MFEAHFHLERTPFQREMPVGRLFLSTAHREGLSRLRYVVEKRLVMLVIGDAGVGKSTLLRQLHHELDPARYEPLYLSQTGATLRSFYTDLLGELRLEAPYSLVKARRLVRQGLLERYETHQRTPVLLLDEAEQMPDVLLENVRGLLNYDYDAFSPFALVLTGTRKLARRLVFQQHEALAGRIQLQFLLTGLTQEETIAYVQHQLEVAGAQRPLFTEPALQKLHQVSKGNPRIINKIATLCLLSAYTARQELIDDNLVGQIVASELTEVAAS